MPERDTSSISDQNGQNLQNHTLWPRISVQRSWAHNTTHVRHIREYPLLAGQSLNSPYLAQNGGEPRRETCFLSHSLYRARKIGFRGWTLGQTLVMDTLPQYQISGRRKRCNYYFLSRKGSTDTCPLLQDC